MNNSNGTRQGSTTWSNGDKDGLATDRGGLQRIRFGDVLKPLQIAAGQGQSWLNDFCNDDVMLPQDLVDVIQAFARMQAENKRLSRAD